MLDRFAEDVPVPHEEGRPMLDPFAEDFGPLSKLLDELPIRPSPAVVCRWHLRGVNGTRLDVLRIAGKLFCTRTELRRFLQESQRPIRTPTAQENEIDAALEAKGLLRSPDPTRNVAQQSRQSFANTDPSTVAVAVETCGIPLSDGLDERQKRK